MAMSPTDVIQVGSEVGDYRVVRLIGRGTTSRVWEAVDPRLPGRRVAIKVLDLDPCTHAEAYARVRREAHILSQIDHPNVIYVIAFGDLPHGPPYLVEELLSGRTLDEHLRRGPLEVDEAVEIAMQIGRALDAAHRLNVFHRDVKPSNIFLLPTVGVGPYRNHVKVVDFGLSVQGNQTVVDATVLGSPRYMAPEQLRSGTVDARTDVFAFGAVVYEMLTGRQAFPGESHQQIAQQILAEESTQQPIRDLAPHVPMAIAEAVEKALEKSPADRHSSATAFTAALSERKLAAHRQRGHARGPRRRSGLLAAAIVSSLGALFAVVALIANLYGLPLRPAHDDAVPHAEATAVNSIAVLDFTMEHDDGGDSGWYCSALKNTLNTALSSLTQLEVVAPEEIYRMARQLDIDPIESARRRGVRQVITGSFVVYGDTIRVDARIIDTRRGVQIAGEWIQGPKEELMDLRNKLALKVLSNLEIELTQAQHETLVAKAKARADKYRMLLDSEGMTGEVRPAGLKMEGGGQPQSLLLPRGGGRGWYSSLVSTAFAQEEDSSASAAVLATLEKYRQAHERGDLDQLASLYVSLPPGQRQAITEYHSHIRDLHVELSEVKIEPRESELMVSYTRRDRFTDRDTGEEMAMDVRLTRFLVNAGGEWKFTADR